MDPAPCLSTHHCSNYPKFQSNYDVLGSRVPHGRRSNRNTLRTKTNRRKNNLCVRALFGAGGDDFRAMKRMMKLASAIENRSIKEFFELIGDECLYLVHNIPPIDFSLLRKNVFMLLHAMMLRHNVTFVLKPVEDAGFDLGIKWSLAWKGKVLPWDLNCNISTTHAYKGLLLISKVNESIVPLIQNILLFIQTNLDAIIISLMDRILPVGTLRENKRSTALLCAVVGLLVMVGFYALFKNIQI